MNMQEIFDTVVAHLRSMDSGRAINSAGHCVYLAPDGKKCAVGVLIPDGHPAQRAQGSARRLLDEHPDLVDLWGLATADVHLVVELLGDLQEVHDRDGNWGVDDRFGLGIYEQKLNLAGETDLQDTANTWVLVYE